MLSTCDVASWPNIQFVVSLVKVLVAVRDEPSETETATSFWRVGCGNLAGWGGSWTGPGAPVANTNYPFNGSLDEATVWLSTLTPTQIAFLYWTH